MAAFLDIELTKYIKEELKAKAFYIISEIVGKYVCALCKASRKYLRSQGRDKY